MYRVIIVDDEPWAIYRLQNLTDWASMGFEIVGTAMDGLSALSMIKEYQPDLLLSDIRMPGLDGLQLIREMKTTSPDTLSVLITGFSDFTYAQDAIRQGVFDYLVKPIRKEDLSKVLGRVRQRLEKRDYLLQESEFFFLLLDGEHPKSVAEIYSALNCKISYPYCRIITSVFADTQYGAFIQKWDGQLPCLSFRTGTKQKSILIPLEYLSGTVTLPAAETGMTASLYTGFSEILPVTADFSILLKQSEIALLTAAMRNTREPVVYSQRTNDMARQILTQFSSALRNGDQQALLLLVDQLAETVGTLQADALLDAVNQMTTLLYEYQYGGYEALEVRHWQEFSPDNPMEAMFSPLRSAILQNDTIQAIPPTQFRKIMNAIEESYTQDIRLSELAKRFYLSASYLSVLIKKETGLTFSNLLIQKRISLAKRMLAETDRPIQDIMEQVGYKDYSHFIKLFKKYAHCTPYAYRKDAVRNSGVSMRELT